MVEEERETAHFNGLKIAKSLDAIEELENIDVLLELAEEYFNRQEHHQVERCVLRLQKLKQSWEISEIASWYYCGYCISETKINEKQGKRYYWMAAELGDTSALEILAISDHNHSKHFMRLCFEYGDQDILRSYIKEKYSYDSYCTQQRCLELAELCQKVYKAQKREMELETLKTVIEIHPKYPHVPKEIFEIIQMFLRA
jgi:hypothetical protein